MLAAVPDGERGVVEDVSELQREHCGPVRVSAHHGLLLHEYPDGAVKDEELQKGQSRQADLRHRLRLPGLLGALQCDNFPADAAAAGVL